MTRPVIVVAGGDRPRWLPDIPADAWIIGVDHGIGHALALGLPVHQAVGDFDSVSPADLDTVVAAGALVERYPVAKDATDFELALRVAVARGAGAHPPPRILVVGGHGGRLDHFLANVLVMAHPDFAEAEIVGYLGDAVVTVVRRAATVAGAIGATLSLLPVHGAAYGVRTTGLRFPLRGETLDAGTTRGVSNEFVAPEASITLDAGVLVAITEAALSRASE